MARQNSGTRRDFLRRSSAATLTTFAGPGSLSIISCNQQPKEEGKALVASKTGFPPYEVHAGPSVEEYATLEAIADGVPVWSFSNLCYIYGACPDLAPNLFMQEGNQRPIEKIKLKKSWEIKYNLCGATSEMAPRTAYNDSQPMLPIHLIDGDPVTAWSSWEFMAPNPRPEWIRIDLPVETEISSIALVCNKERNPHNGAYGKALPKELEIKISRDGSQWETIHSDKQVPVDQQVIEVKFKPRRAKQVWIIGNNFQKITYKNPNYERYAFSISRVEIRDPRGANLALVSRGASVTVSSTSYVELNDRFSQDALWVPLNCDIGNKWVRVGDDNGPFVWYFVEREKGKLDFDRRADESISELQRYGINSIVALDFKGNWLYEQPPRKTNWREARFRECNDCYHDYLPPSDTNPEMYQGYLRYIEYMAGRLKGRVTYLEPANEWNFRFAPDYYVKTFFEPSYKAIKRVWPEAKIMLGSPAGFDRNAILDCLGRERKYGISGGKLLLNGGDIVGPGGVWPNPDRPGALAVRQDPKAGDVGVSVDAQDHGIFGIVLRYQDPKHYLAAICAIPDHTISFYEVIEGDWGKPVAAKKFAKLGSDLKLVAKVQGQSATFTVSDGSQSVSTNYTVQHITAPGTAGLIHRMGDSPELFDNFEMEDGQGRSLAKDNFDGRNGAVPAGWTYVTGGANPIAKGWGARIDAIGWHPGNEPDAKYFAEVRELQKKCRDLGFNGPFFATEIYVGSMYPPGTQSYPMITSEIQMAKYLTRSLVGHNGLGVEAGPCHPHFTGYAHAQALCQATWPVQTLNPCRPTVGYYMWRNVATVMDDFHPTEFPVTFSNDNGLLHFTFQRGDNERMLAVWIDGPSKEEIAETKTDIVFPGIHASRVTVVDVMNGTEQALEVSASGAATVLKGMRIKDYPVFVRLS